MPEGIPIQVMVTLKWTLDLAPPVPRQLSTQQQEGASGSPPTASQSTWNQIQSLYLGPRVCPESLSTPHDFCLVSFWLHLTSV